MIRFLYRGEPVPCAACDGCDPLGCSQCAQSAHDARRVQPWSPADCAGGQTEPTPPPMRRELR